ncbi:MAG: NADH-ubiquinone oxidoreductase subunit E family protein [Campylobacteraceae bacterium]|jgi:NADH-quinone oxidoreductase subunit E|nr:NADH-ubiquinone oxidoreductase subunit E family protein [Campylobacteraceae bacterium]
MKRYDLRGYKNGFKAKFFEILEKSAQEEVLIFVFEIVSDGKLKDIIDTIREKNCEVLNSLKFNEVDWTIVVRAKSFNE